MTKVESITLFLNNRYLAKLTSERNPDLFLQSEHLEFTIDKIDSFGNFDSYESDQKSQNRIDLLEAKVTLKIELDIDVENRKFEIKGRAKNIELLGDIEIYNSKSDLYDLRKAIIRSVNNSSSMFYYNLSAKVDFIEDDWMKEGIKDAI